MTQKSGLAAVIAAALGKQPAGDTVPRADHMSAIEAAVTQAFGEGETAGKLVAASAATAAGSLAERTRVKTILAAPEAEGRQEFARMYAFETDLSAEAAIEGLKGKPKAEAPKAGSRLDALMPGNNPKLTEPGTTEEADLDAVSLAAMDRAIAARGMKPVGAN